MAWRTRYNSSNMSSNSLFSDRYALGDHPSGGLEGCKPSNCPYFVGQVWRRSRHTWPTEGDFGETKPPRTPPLAGVQITRYIVPEFGDPVALAALFWYTLYSNR